MKRTPDVFVVAVCLAGLSVLATGNSFSTELVFKDTQYSFQTLRALGYAVSGGAEALIHE